MATLVLDSTALLTYSLMTTPSPVEVSPASGPPRIATLTFVVSAPVSVGSLTVKSIVFNLPSGVPAAPDPADLTDDPGSIRASVTSSGADQWQIGPGAAPGSFVVRPAGGQPAVIAGQALTVSFTNVAAAAIVGTALITIVEDSTAPAQPRRLTVAVPKFPAGFYALDLRANAPQVSLGRPVTLTWVGSPNAIFTMLYGDQSVDVTTVRKWTSPPLYTSTAFVLRAAAAVDGQKVSLDLTATVMVASPDIVIFEAAPDEIGYDEPVVLTWRSVDADGVYLRLGQSNRETLPPVSDPASPKVVHPRYDAPYTLQAFKNQPDGTPMLSSLYPLGMTFKALDIKRFAADPEIVDTAHPSTRITWDVAHAKSVTYCGKDVPATGSSEEHPTSDTTYPLAATWVDGQVTTKTVAVVVKQLAVHGVTTQLHVDDISSNHNFTRKVTFTVTLTFAVDNATSGRLDAKLTFFFPFGPGESPVLSATGRKTSETTWDFPVQCAAADVWLYKPFNIDVDWSFDGLQNVKGHSQLTCAPPSLPPG